MRVFPDTNVLFAALATRGLCADLLRALLVEHDLVIGEPVLEELRRNLATKLRMPPERVALATEFLLDLERAPAADPGRRRPARLDAADAAILACGAAAGANAIVTGDRAMLALKTYAGIPVVSPRELWRMLQSAAR